MDGGVACRRAGRGGAGSDLAAAAVRSGPGCARGGAISAGYGAALVGHPVAGRALERSSDGFGLAGRGRHGPISLGAPSELPGSVYRNGGGAADSYRLDHRAAGRRGECLGVEKPAASGGGRARGPSAIPGGDVRKAAILAQDFLKEPHREPGRASCQRPVPVAHSKRLHPNLVQWTPPRAPDRTGACPRWVDTWTSGSFTRNGKRPRICPWFVRAAIRKTPTRSAGWCAPRKKSYRAARPTKQSGIAQLKGIRKRRLISEAKFISKMEK